MLEIKTTDIDEAITLIKEYYNENEVCLAELLDNIILCNMNVNDVVKVYSLLFSMFENDKVFRMNWDEGTVIDLCF